MIDPLYLFVFLGLFSPGPNVLMLTASGARFGFQPTVPHLLGVALGVGFIAAATGMGIGAVLAQLPTLELTLKIAASAWILWMAWRLWQSAAGRETASARPMRFHEAVLFQWINPKIWAVALAAASGYGAGLSPMGEALRLGIAFSSLNLLVCLFWTSAGSLLKTILSTPRAWTVFARAMSLCLAGSAAMVFL